MKAAAVALLSLACLAPLTASAEWQWLDNDGRRVFSDQPPPPDIAPNRILKQGKGALAAMPVPAPAPVAANTPVGVDPSLRPSGKDKGLEEKRKQAEAAEGEEAQGGGRARHRPALRELQPRPHGQGQHRLGPAASPWSTPRASARSWTTRCARPKASGSTR
jgi:hypothetical protein